MSRATQLEKVYMSGFFFNVSYLIFAVLIPLDALHLHLTVWAVGILAALSGILQLPLRILSGPLVDRWGSRSVLWVTFSLEFLAGIVVIGGQSLPMATLVSGQFLIGAARGLFWTAAQSEVSRQPGNRPHHLGLFTSFTKSGALIGIAATGVTAEFLGIYGGFMVSDALAFIALVIGLSLTHTGTRQRPPSFWRAALQLLPASHQPFVVVNGLIAILCAVPQALAQSFYPVVLIRLGLSESAASLITALMSLGMIVAGFVGSIALQRLGMRRMVAVSTVMVALSLSSTAFHHIIVDATAILCGGFAAGWLNVAFLTAVTSRSNDGNRGTNLAVTEIYFVLAVLLTPLISGWLLSQVGRSTTFLIEGSLAFVVALLVMLLWRWQNHSRCAQHVEQRA